MRSSHIGRVSLFTLLVSLAMICGAVVGYAQAPKVPPSGPRTPAPAAPAKPAPRKPADPAPAAAPKPAPAADVRFKSKYTTGDQVTESVTYLKNNRERYELADMILLKQHDQNRVVQISRSAKTYLVSPDGVPAIASMVDQAAAQKAPGVVLVATSIVDTGERKTAFGLPARHIKTIIERQPQPGACDQSRQRIETDAWYVDAPKSAAGQDNTDGASSSTSCHDEVKTTQNGDPKVLGFPISYNTTFLDADGKPMVVAMEVTEFEITSLDASLFEIPQGFAAVMNAQELSKAVSNANETKLASGELAAAAPQKKLGSIRVGVPEVANKTTQALDTRALRTKLIADLAEAKVDAVPLAAAPQPQLEARAAELGIDYLLMAEVTELKASKPGGLSKMMKVTAGDSSAGKDITEAKLNVQLVAPGSKPRLSTTTSAKDGGIGVKTGLGIAKVAGTMYMRMALMGGMYGSPMGAFNTMRLMNMGGMGMLGDPSLMALQTGMGSGLRMGMGLDRTAGAASFLMQQAMIGSAGGPQQGPSFDASLSDALEDAAKNVVEALKKPEPVKKK